MMTGIRFSSLLLILSVILFSCTDIKKDFWENGNLRSELSYDAGKLNGSCTWYYENGQKEQEAFYSDNRLNGIMRRWHPNGRIESEMLYVEGKRDGTAITYDAAGNKIIEEQYSNDTLSGPFRQWHADGTPKVEGAYLHGLFEGRWVYYDAAGVVVGTGDFRHGSGLQKGWWPNGKIMREIQYKDNLKHGYEKWFDENGVLERQFEYEAGNPVQR